MVIVLLIAIIIFMVFVYTKPAVVCLSFTVRVGHCHCHHHCHQNHPNCGQNYHHYGHQACRGVSSVHSERIQSASIIVIFISIITVINMIFIMVTRPADVCLPFTVKVGDGVGRYVVATRDIKAGQVIMIYI